MASFPANFICSNAIKLRYRVCRIPWVKRASAVSCGNSRDYSRSSPVKYIPKKSSGSNINEAGSSHNGTMRHKGSWPVPFSELDASTVEFSKMGFFNYETKNHTENGLSLGMQVEEEFQDSFMAETDELIEEPEEAIEDCYKTFEGIPVGKNQQDVERKAIELLGTRNMNQGAYTALELKKKLQGKRFALEIVDAVMMDLQKRGLINDFLYAEAFCRSRWSSSSWGPQRIKQALFRKGVNAEDTEKAIKLVFEDGEDDIDQDPGISMSKHSMDHLYVQASKQWLRSQGASEETRKSRIVRWLQYRGFNWSVIKYVLNKLQTDSP